jgi:hypothetical protein
MAIKAVLASEKKSQGELSYLKDKKGLILELKAGLKEGDFRQKKITLFFIPMSDCQS